MNTDWLYNKIMTHILSLKMPPLQTATHRDYVMQTRLKRRVNQPNYRAGPTLLLKQKLEDWNKSMTVKSTHINKLITDS